MAEDKACARLLDEIMALLDGELDDDSCRRVEDHLRKCPRCEACREILSRSRRLCSERLPLPESRRRDILRRLEDALRK